MKIGIFTPYLDTLTGGEKYMLTLASCLSDSHEVFIFWKKDQEEKIRNAAKSKLGIDLSIIEFHANIFSQDYSFISRLIESRKYDLIIFLSDGSIPFLFTNLIIHFQFPVQWVDASSLKTKLKIPRVKKIICNSFFTKKYIDEKFHVKGNVLYPPVDIVKKKKVKKENIIFHLGRFGLSAEGKNYKKQDVMIQAFKQMVDNGLLDWTFVIGVSIQEKDLEELAGLKTLARGYPIEFLVNPKFDELWNRFNAARIYWHASGFGEDLKLFPERAEHFGISTVEAMGCGQVPVVINAGGQKEIITENEDGFLWNTIDELLEKTSLLIEDQTLLKKMSQNAEAKAKKFNKKHFCDRLESLIV